MRLLLIAGIALFVSSCGTTRVLVKDCQKLNGLGDQQNCELIKEL